MARLISLPIALLALCGCGSASDDKAEDTAPGGETTTATQTNGTSTVTGTHTTTTTTITDTTPSDAVVLGDWTLTPNENVGSILVLAWEQGKAGDVWAEYSFDEDVWMSTPVMSAGAGSHELPLLGIPFATEADVRIWSSAKGEEPESIETTQTTGDLPTGLLNNTVLTRDDEAIDDAIPWVLMSMEGSGRTGPWTVIIDRQGRYVWAVETGGGFWTMHVQPSYDGSHILIDRNSFWGMFDGGDASNVVRVTIDGEVVSTTDTPGLHHPFTELPDGTLAWGAAQGFFAGDETLKTVAPDGTRNTLWSCEDWLLSIGESVSCGSNTLRWDALTDTFLFSLYTVETVVEIDAKTGNANRWFGHVNGSWGFDPEESAFWWQHGGYYTDARTFLTSSKNVDGGDETVIREYTLDEEREMLVEVWNFGLGEGVYGATMGEAHRLPGGNTLHNYGREVRLREATPEGEVVWDIRWPSASDEIGRSTPLSNLYDFDWD